jgi:hypothetical protein
VAALQAQPWVAAGAVGVLGHSEGGWVALRLCAQLGTPRHLIMNSCPAVSFTESEVYALTRAGAEHGRVAALMQQLTETVRAGHGYQEGQRILATCQHEPWYPALAAGGFSLDAAAWSQLGAGGNLIPAPTWISSRHLPWPSSAATIHWPPSRPASRACGKPLTGLRGPSRSPSSPVLITGCRPALASPPDT